MNDILSRLKESSNENGVSIPYDSYLPITLEENLEMVEAVREVAYKDKWIFGKGKHIPSSLFFRLTNILPLFNDIQPRIIYSYDGYVKLHFYNSSNKNEYWIFIKDSPETVVIRRRNSTMYPGKLVIGRKVFKSNEIAAMVNEVKEMFS